MIIKLFNYDGEEKQFEIGDINNIGRMFIEVISGDEVLNVIQKDYSINRYDSSESRCEDFCDGGYDVFYPKENINLLESKEFIDRGSYKFLYK